MSKRSRLNLPGDTHAEPDRSKRYKPCRHLIILAQNPDARIRKATGQQHEFLRLSHWQVFEQQGVDKAEHGCIGPNAERQCERYDSGEAGTLAQYAQSITQILRQLFNPSHASRIAALLLTPLDAAHRT